MLRDTLGVLLAGGAGERLFPLTRDRAKPAVPFAGMYRIIDITLSNCINSDLRKVYILTQYKALSLNRHIREGWGGVVATELGEFIEILPPMQRVSKSLVPGHGRRGLPEHLLHRRGRAQVRAHPLRRPHLQDELRADDAAAPATPAQTSRSPRCRSSRKRSRSSAWSRFRKSGEVIGFVEKPKQTDLRSPFNPEMVDASMGIYLFNTDVLLPELMRDAEDPDSKHDFGHDILPKLLGRYRMCAYNFVDENKQQALYWRDVGTLDAYYEANMDVASFVPTFNLYDKSWPMRSRSYQYPPAKFVFGEPGRTGTAINSIVSGGCIVSGSVVRSSVLSHDVRVNSYADVDSSVIFSHVNIGRHCRIRHAIIDRNVNIPDGTVIGYDPAEDKKNYFVSPSGLTVVTRDYSVYENPVSPEFLAQNF